MKKQKDRGYMSLVVTIVLAFILARTFKTRFNEHTPKPSTNKHNSAFANRLINYNHNYSSVHKNLEVLYSHRKRGRFLDTLEKFEIFMAGKKHPRHILNEKSS
jgi:hypothetical protein